MPQEFGPGCQRPAIKKQNVEIKVLEGQLPIKEEMKTMIKVGKPAPDFTASAFYQGKFVNVSLSEYIGKWVLLCFYPGDFTFV
jgi:hypothetical protein